MLKSAPRAQTGAIIAAARAFLGMTWALVLSGLLVVGFLAREYLQRTIKQQESKSKFKTVNAILVIFKLFVFWRLFYIVLIWVLSVQSDHDLKIDELKSELSNGREERVRLKESSDVVVQCIKALQRKLDNESQMREQFVEKTDMEKAIQNKKLDG